MKKIVLKKIIKKINNLKIVLKVTLLLSILFLILILAILPYQVTIYKNDVYEINRDVLRKMVISYAHNSAHHLEKYIQNNELLDVNEDANYLKKEAKTELDYLVEDIVSTEYIIEVQIIDIEGNIVAEAKDSGKKHYPKEPEIIQRRIEYNTHEIGKLVVKVNISKFDEIVTRHSISLLTYSILLFIVLLFVILQMIKVFILNPINKINQAIENITAGDHLQKIPVDSKDEVGTFAQNFNNMLTDLNDSIALNKCIIESSPFTWIALDEHFRIIQCNSLVRQFMYLDSEGMFNGEVDIPMDADYHTLVGCILWEKLPFFIKYHNDCSNVLATGKHIKLHREHMINERYIQVNLFPLIEESFKGFVIRVEDVTDEETKDAQLRQSLKIESLGILAGGLAHDFNNVLSGISSTISILKFRLQNKAEVSMEKLGSLVEIIENASNRAGDMVKQMLSLSRKQEITFTPVDLNSCISHVAKIGKNTFDKTVIIDTIPSDKKAMTLADPSQLESVILNLAINSWHAMTLMRKEGEKQGGTLTIKIEATETDKYIKESDGNNRWWLISIVDTGVGISKENQRKIFDPFFTTKDKGKGTGLGLAMVKDIIDQHNGFLKLYSEVGVGSRFYIYLPIMSDEDPSLNSTSEQNVYKGNKETVLVADDEPIIREVVKNILEEANYRAIIVPNGFEAIKTYKNNYQDISLVLLDMSMPEMNGQEAYSKLKEINPNVKVVFCSGFNLTDHDEHFKQIGVKGFVEKPYTLHKLSKIIYDAMNS
jgi:signal transduction histidine kinase/CheY-like chemotaxis protein/HAMP domain-containing protein